MGKDCAGNKSNGWKFTKRERKFLLLWGMPLYFMTAGFLLQPLSGIGAGLIRIMEEPDFLITDYVVIGGIGAALVNASLLALLCVGIVYGLGMEISGHTITSVFLMFGFSLFGKNLLNIWSILTGVCLYARYHKTSVKRYIYVGFYGTSLSPLITQVMRTEHFGPGLGLTLSCALGIVMGFVLPPLATHTSYFHKGYSLYNVGFAGGIIATVVVSVMKSFGLEVQSRLVWHTGSNGTFALLLLILFGGMAGVPVAANWLFEKKEGSTAGRGSVFRAYKRILKTSGVSGPDFIEEAGIPATVLNMGINGLFATLFVIAVGGDLNGPVVGGIMTIVGFSATGKHIRNIMPVMAGVYIAGLTKSWEITDPSAMLALLFSTTLAPVAGEFGPLAGMLAGYLHSSVALNVGIVYSGMNLYNNGFAGGIVAMFLVPVILSVRDRRARARGGLSL